MSEAEEKLANVKFNIHKFSKKPKPDNINQIMIICCFSEFGCEVIGSLYCVPRFVKENPDKYVIVVGWYGREYLYKHLVDEFWEIKEDCQWLRDYSLAFHHSSKNLSKLEKSLSQFSSKVITSEGLGKLAVGNQCHKCNWFWGQVEGARECPKCNSTNITKSLFSDVKYWKQKITHIPSPTHEKIALAKTFLGNNPVAIIARNRKTYGRNLQPEFYVKLIELLQKRNYTPIWLGEKQTTLECPVPGIVDLTRKEEARDLELTLAIIKQCKYTFQFWTASTRLAALMETPYLIFESPDQLYGQGQEAYRLGLCTTGKKKVVLCHYLNVFNDNDKAINLLNHCIEEMEQDNWNDVIGMVEEPEVVLSMRKSANNRFGE